MNLSILIPVYNHDISELVKSLCSQLVKINNNKNEIVLLDDGSNSSYLSQYINYASTSYLKVYYNPLNLGRELSRKKLSEIARNENILFLDCDSGIISNDFIKNYTRYPDENIVTGGRVYGGLKPIDKKKILHWRYGNQREVFHTKTAFLSNNFLIKKSIFDTIPNTNFLQGYGHEDTYWGIWFKQKKYSIKKIDNPVLHESLEDCDTFLDKTEQAILNLKSLSKHIKHSELKNHVVLFKYYLILKNTKLDKVFVQIHAPFLRYFKRNILSSNPKIFVFNYYKLIRFAAINLE